MERARHITAALIKEIENGKQVAFTEKEVAEIQSDSKSSRLKKKCRKFSQISGRSDFDDPRTN